MIFEVKTPGQNIAIFEGREDTNDYNLVNSVIGEDEYGLGALSLEGWAIDIGAHIGAVSITLALDNPNLHVLAVEPVYENAAMLKRNAARSGVASRVHVRTLACSRPGVFNVAISFGYTQWGDHDPGYVKAHRFIGNQYRQDGEPSDTLEIAAVPLGGLMALLAMNRVSLLKIDAEGAEWDVLQDPAVARCDRIIGELHSGAEGMNMDAAPSPEHEEAWEPGRHACREEFAHLHRLLDATHLVEINKPIEQFVAVRR